MRKEIGDTLPRAEAFSLGTVICVIILLVVGVLAAIHWPSTPELAPLLGKKPDGELCGLVPRFWTWVCYAFAWISLGLAVMLEHYPRLWYHPTELTYAHDNDLRDEYAEALEKAREEERLARENGGKLSVESRRILKIQSLPLLSEKLYEVAFQLCVSLKATVLFALLSMVLAATDWMDEPIRWMTLMNLLFIVEVYHFIKAIRRLRKGRWTLKNERKERNATLLQYRYDQSWKNVRDWSWLKIKFFSIK